MIEELFSCCCEGLVFSTCFHGAYRWVYCRDVCWKMFKAGTTLEFSPLPYIAALLNCVFWIFYGSKKVQKDGLLVMTINGVGAGLEVIYIVIFFWFAARKVKVS